MRVWFSLMTVQRKAMGYMKGVLWNKNHYELVTDYT